jgi:hypothetical protein
VKFSNHQELHKQPQVLALLRGIGDSIMTAQNQGQGGQGGMQDSQKGDDGMKGEGKNMQGGKGGRGSDVGVQGGSSEPQGDRQSKAKGGQDSQGQNANE